MNNMHMLSPCRLCPTRMAVPGMSICTICDVSIEAMVPDGVWELLDD